MGTIKTVEDARCYGCNKRIKNMLGFLCSDGLYITYCTRCLKTNPQLKSLLEEAKKAGL